jgi:nicotinamide riboside kinase
MKISISGSFSVGKSTVFEELKKHLSHFSFLGETTREVMEEMKKTNVNMTVEDKITHQLISTQRQIKKESENANFITDYCAIDYLNYTYGLSIYDEVYTMVQNHLQNLGGYDIVFYIPIEFQPVKDGYRFEDGSFQKEIDDRLKRLLNEFHQPYITITGSVEDRKDQILKNIKQANNSINYTKA